MASCVSPEMCVWKRIFCVIAFLVVNEAFPQQGIWNFDLNQVDDVAVVSKTVFSNSHLYIHVSCDNHLLLEKDINISYVLWAVPCFEETVDTEDPEALPESRALHERPEALQVDVGGEPAKFSVLKSKTQVASCGKHNTISVDPVPFSSFKGLSPITTTTSTLPKADGSKNIVNKVDDTSKSIVKSPSDMKTTVEQKAASAKDVTGEKVRRDVAIPNAASAEAASDAGTKTTVAKVVASSQDSNSSSKLSGDGSKQPSGDEAQVTLEAEGVYRVSVRITPFKKGDTFNASVEIKISGEHGYLSAVDWPLLPFYGVLCGVYVIFGVVWLVVSACQWRDLLRIQFWIGGVIVLGMLEKAVLYAEYQSINTTGRSVEGAVLFAEVISCLKRTLARMLVIIVSLGFGIVKPRLGPLLHRVVGVGLLYFVLSVVAASMQIFHMRNDPNRQLMLAEISLAVLDSIICWWIFSSLVQTTRTLRLRRNIVKLTLYRHFTNTLIFAVIASIAYTVWYVRSHRWPTCLTDWKELWVDEAYWRLLFSIILLVIMILWRPTNNNQRYAFTPLLDAPDDDEDEQVMSDAFEGMKMRGFMKNQNHVSPKDNDMKGVDEDLKWVEEHIPSTIADSALPTLLDSDEEIMTTKFEISKMN